ncbi:UNVERIFIED_CONTAM: hypothetical protein Q9R58_07735 [Methylobacteriaceae bacterium AG10]|nr:hypothetical protein [Methylobacteriaceae bacterium AG10]
MAPDKSLAAEIEAVTERERTRLIAWLERYALASGSRIDREITADALMADFMAPLIAEAETLRSDVSSLQNDCANEIAARRAELDRHATEIAAFQSREGLIAFACEIIGYAFDGMDADGADIQALALTHGLLIKESYDPKRHGPSMEAEPGDDWYTLAGPLALAEQEKGDA